MALSGKQERRLWRCLDRMRWQPSNPADVKAKMVEFTVKQEAATALRDAVYAATEKEGADSVNGYLREAEGTLELEPMEAKPGCPSCGAEMVDAAGRCEDCGALA